jgi:DNA polymerase-1
MSSYGDLDRTKKEVPIFMVGDFPRDIQDDDRGQPFHPRGKCGRILRNTLKKYSVNTNTIVFGNAIRCRPDRNTLPSENPIKQCNPHLIEEIEQLRPKVILALGAQALRALLGNGHKLGEARNSILHYAMKDGTEIPVLSAYHPSFAVRDRNNEVDFKKDIRRFSKYLKTGKIGSSSTREKLLGKNDSRYTMDATVEEFQAFVEEVYELNVPVAMDYETNNRFPWSIDNFLVSCIGLSYLNRSGKAVSLTMRVDTLEKKCKSKKKLTAIRNFIKDREIPKVAHYAKYEMLVSARRFGVRLRNVVSCTKIKHYEIFPEHMHHDLTSSSVDLLGISPWDTEIKKLTKDPDNWMKLDWDKLAPYCAQDCAACIMVDDKLNKSLKKRDEDFLEMDATGYRPSKVFDTVVMPALFALTNMEINGMLIDVDYASKLETELKGDMANHTAHMRTTYTYVMDYEKDRVKKLLASDKSPKTSRGIESAIAKLKYNPGSDNQIRDIVFGENYFGCLPHERMLTKKKAPQANKEHLTWVAEENNDNPTLGKFIKDSLYYKGISKDLGTYTIGILKRRSLDDRIRPTFHQDTASTGRLSCVNPNLQNVKKVKRLRRMYIPGKGNMFVEADYSQIELRCLAVAADDPGMKEIFKNNWDLHEETARAVFEIPQDTEVTDELRKMAKAVNFGIVYGISAHGLSANLGIPQDEAEVMVNNMLNRFPCIGEWQDDMIQFAKETGCVYTLFGRRRVIKNAQITPRD